MPVLIPMAINTGFYIQYLIQEFASFKHKKESIPVHFNFGLLGILAIIFPLIVFVTRKGIDFPLHNSIIASGFLIPSGFLLLRFLRKKNMTHVFYTTLFLYAIVMCTVIPILARNQNQNEAFAPITALREEASKRNLEIYLLDAISPEMLWDYGSSIPLVERVDSSYAFPDLEKFGLLVNDKDELLKSNAEARFHVREAATYNRNVLKQSARRHRPRNISYYYILTTKE